MSGQQSETTITVSGYGRKLCVLSESSKKSTAGKTTTKAKKATTAKKPAAKKATRKKNTDIVEVEAINEGTYMSDVARKLAGNYDVEERERELAP